MEERECVHSIVNKLLCIMTSWMDVYILNLELLTWLVYRLGGYYGLYILPAKETHMCVII